MSTNWTSAQTPFGFSDFKGNQQAIIESVSGGKDTFVIMPTGGGKSLCYQLPALVAEGTAIVVSPLIALMKNQVDAIRGYSEADSVAHVLNSSLTKKELDQVHKDLIAERPNYFTSHQNRSIKTATSSFSSRSSSVFLPLMRHIVFQSGDTISAEITVLLKRVSKR